MSLNILEAASVRFWTKYRWSHRAAPTRLYPSEHEGRSSPRQPRESCSSPETRIGCLQPPSKHPDRSSSPPRASDAGPNVASDGIDRRIARRSNRPVASAAVHDCFDLALGAASDDYRGDQADAGGRCRRSSAQASSGPLEATGTALVTSLTSQDHLGRSRNRPQFGIAMNRILAGNADAINL